jgi:hypothetical protein
MKLTIKQKNKIYSNEADILNMNLFGVTAKEWRNKNKGKIGNIRDYANISQLVCLSNLENINALLINENMSQLKRLSKLNTIAIYQMNLLIKSNHLVSINKKVKRIITNI